MCFELVTHSVPSVDEFVGRCTPIDLLPELADEDVDGAVAPRQPPAPDLLEQLVARQHSALVAGEGIEEPELGGRQLDVLAVDVGLEAPRVDAELFDLDRLAALDLLGAHAASGRDPDAGDELFIEKGLTR